MDLVYEEWRNLTTMAEELVGTPHEGQLDRTIRYLQSRVDLSKERVHPGQLASKVLDIMVARLEGGDTNLSGMGAFRKVLLELEGMATSMEFDCPICAVHWRMAGTREFERLPQLTLTFDEEVGEAGSILSSWPVLEGTCEDPVLEPGERPIWRGHLLDRQPRNHAAQVNKENEDGGFITANLERILGEYVGRRKLAEYLGVRRG